jgi:hypothetical protein
MPTDYLTRDDGVRPKGLSELGLKDACTPFDWPETPTIVAVSQAPDDTQDGTTLILWGVWKDGGPVAVKYMTSIFTEDADGLKGYRSTASPTAFIPADGIACDRTIGLVSAIEDYIELSRIDDVHRLTPAGEWGVTHPDFDGAPELFGSTDRAYHDRAEEWVARE